MTFYDATQWTDRESVNVPAAWNLTPIKMLYEKDFYADGEDTNLPPSDARIKQIAKATKDQPLVCINIGEGWRLFLPGSWGYDNQTVPGDVYNETSAAKVVSVLAEFRRWNTDSKLMWWGLPHQASIYNISQVPAAMQFQYGWRGPVVTTAPYNGIIEMESWFGRQVRGYLDFTAPNAYYKADIADSADMTYEQFWSEQILAYKTVSDAGYGLPVIYFIMPRKSTSPTQFIADPVHRAMLARIKSMLAQDDGVAWWEGNSAEVLNAQLAAYDATDNWIGFYGGIANVG